MDIFGIPEDVYETSAKKFQEKRNEKKEEKKERFKTAASRISGKTAREVIHDAILSRLGMTEEEYEEASQKLMDNSPSVNNTSAAKSAVKNVISSAQSVLPDKNVTTPQTGASAKPIVYSDWAPAAQQFGMDQQTAYAEHMANTAHQREVADLRAAGLNPVLGVGSGASGVAGHVATSGASAQKSLNGDSIVDAIGATAAVVTAILTKNPAYGYMAGKAVNAVGDMFTKTK